MLGSEESDTDGGSLDDELNNVASSQSFNVSFESDDGSFHSAISASDLKSIYFHRNKTQKLS